MLTLLAVDGVISAVLAAFFLPLRLGSVPFPVSALLSGLLNAGLVWAALQWTSSPRLAALPLWTWLATVAGLTFPGPGDDEVFSAEYALLLLIVLGALPPALLLYRRTPAALALTRRRRRLGPWRPRRTSLAACCTFLTTFLAVSRKLLATVVGAFATSSAALSGLPARTALTTSFTALATAPRTSP